MQVPTSTGKIRDLESVGTLKFSWKGQPLRLTAFLEEGERRLFVPFTDLTTGTETYAAGRYLNLDPTATGIYVVDFNAAYHPYCYYSDEFDCPFPPPENRLAIAVQAGERLPQARSGEPRCRRRAALQAIVFDFDGVIADSERLHLRAYQDVLAAEGVTLSSDAYYDRYLGYDDVGVFKAIGKDHDIPDERCSRRVAHPAEGRTIRSAGLGRRDAVSGRGRFHPHGRGGRADRDRVGRAHP